MDEPTSQYLFKETRLNLEADSPSSVVTLHVGGQGRSLQSSRRPTRPQQPWQDQGAESETSFAREHLASSAAVYFGRKHTYPRSLLWRVLSGRKVLSLRFLDIIYSPGEGSDAFKELRIVFPDAIRPAGVSAADSDDHDSLEIFVVTVSGDLYTIPLKLGLFQRPSPSSSTAIVKSDANRAWYQTYLSPSFTFRFPHRLAARTPHELVVALHDGGVLRLTRSPGSDGALSSDYSVTGYC